MKPETEQTIDVHKLLLAEYGDRPWHPHDPVATLVRTILSQNTNDVNRDRAYEQLRERFPTWEAVREAPEDALVEAIRPAGLGPTKAPRIQQALRRITAAQDEISLDFLADLPVDEAREWLLALPGVGPKTAAIVLLFALGKPAFPVDTHVHRVSRRLGLIPEGTSRERAHALLSDIVPKEIYYAFHLNLIAHGRAICHARSPECIRCVLQQHCAYYAALIQPATSTLQLILVRHGQTVANVEGRWIGWSGTELTALGRMQVEATARRLAAEITDGVALYTSPLSRARKTAEEIGRELGLEAVTVEDLREIDFGELDGVSLEEMEARYPELYARWKNRADSDYTWPGGERRADFFRRVAAACDELLSRHAQGSVIIVTHGGTTRACLAHLLPHELGEWWSYPLGNCSVTRVAVENGEARLTALNDTDHLSD
ncbi:MAG: histidine phosphatase family protein [Anaerolineae bacterium]|jgi:endonuclease-3